MQAIFGMKFIQNESNFRKLMKLQKVSNSTPLNEPLHGHVNGKKLIPDETHVLDGFYNNQSQYNWISKKRMFNSRMGSGNGSH